MKVGKITASTVGMIMVTLVWGYFVDANPSPPPIPLTVHEWGTFTSVYGSDGRILPGVHQDEESLPYFVYAHDTAPGARQVTTLPDGTVKNPFGIMFGGKGIHRPVSNVTVKMETPVLYFYSPESLDATVNVGFNGGSISQWYPHRSGGEEMPVYDPKKPGKLEPIDFAKPYEGSIEWKFRVEPRTSDTDFEVMKNGEFPNWIHPRAPKSNLLRAENGETETYLFYRGMGNFDQPVNYRIEDNQLIVGADESIPFMLVVDIQSASYGRILFAGDPGEKQILSLVDGESGNLRTEAYQELKTQLIEAGLFDDEASAMLRTWWHSYFDKPGLRAFWIVPRDFTDDILPINIEPKPEKMERVLLGRSEILRPEFEERIVTEFSKEDQDKNSLRYERYYPVYAARYHQLTN